jgi:hypothetical protein
MRIDLACGVNIGDTLYNCFMQPLKVKDRITYSVDTYPSSRDIKFIVSDSNNGHIHEYSHKDLYLADLEGECDEEKSWVNWAKDNKDFFEAFDHIETMKEIYKIGFGNGFDYKRQITYDEIMQK